MIAAWMTMALVSCDVDKTEDGELPDVKVEVEGEAKLPKYDVHGPDVTVGKKKVDARTILTYGQSDNPTSPWSSDQTEMFADKQWVEFPWTPAQIQAHKVSTVTVTG